MPRFYNQRMMNILRNYIDEINLAQQQEIKAINDDLPFTKKEIIMEV